MPPLTPEQNNAITTANKNATVNADTITNKETAPVLPVVKAPEVQTVNPLDINQYIAPKEGIDTTALENQTSSVFEELLGANKATETRGADTTRLEQKAGIPQLTTDLVDIQNEINQKSLTFRREREAIQKTAGLTASQANARLADVSRKQSAELADLEVVRAARSNSLNAIQSIIDRKVERQFADEDARINNLKFIYDNVKGDLTKAQDRKYQEMINRENRGFELAKGRYEQLESAKGELVKNAQLNGAGSGTLQKIMGAKDLATAYSLAGNYGLSIDDKLKRAQLAKINEAKATTVEASDMDKDSDFKKLKGNAELKNKLTAYKTLVDKYGAQRKGRANAAILDNAYQEVLQAYRASKDLGALQGADLSLVDDAIKRATFEKTALGKIINVPLVGIPSGIKKGVTKRGAEASIEEAFNSIDRSTSQLTSTIQSKNPDWVSTPYFQATVGSQEIDITTDENGNIVLPGEDTNEDFWSI